ncbi:Zinc finger protein [Nesidiocoris tenuis]|uniref:Zinc finger protein n=1 Tax=Nesidiocoris tenuis TaxID=355587 RepID=A0ABN7AMC0_9HEMI|nr:Zinc finger protein [Nesidiocoris tenuis]
MGSEHYCLRWNNHQSNLLGVFSQLLEAESLVDVTLASSEGHSLRAHKVVLSACSSYFRALFLDHPARHPIVILKDVCFTELRTLVEFMYRGEVSVETCRLPALLKTAESLKVKGLAEMAAGKASNKEDGGAAVAHERTGSSTEERHRREESPPPPPRPPPPPPTSDDVPPPSKSRTPPRPPSAAPSPEQPPSVPCEDEPMRLSPSRPPPSDDRPTDMDDDDVDIDDEDACSVQSGPSDMTPHRCGMPVRHSAPHSIPPPHSPHPSEPLPGPSGLPPVQDAPLSLKKEVEWDRDDRSQAGESSSEYRHPHDPENSSDVGSEVRSVYSCVYCGAAFPHQSKLTRHLLGHSMDTLKGYTTATSGNGSGRDLAGYGVIGPPPPHYPPLSLVKTEPTSPGALCKFCGKTFPDVGTLITHLPAHTGDRPFKCEFCGKAFKLRHHMKDHCRVHTGERPFRCSLCGKTFSRSTILKAHEKTHYPKYVRKFLSSPSPEDERRPMASAPAAPHLPCDLSVESLCMPRQLPCDLSSTDGPPLYLPRTSPSP